MPVRYAVWHCYCNKKPVERSSGGITPWLTAWNVAIGGFGRQHADHVPKLICVNARDVCALLTIAFMAIGSYARVDTFPSDQFCQTRCYFQSLPLQASA